MQQSHFHGYVYHDKRSIQTATFVSSIFKTKAEAEAARKKNRKVKLTTVSPLYTYGGSYDK